jgi:hypothetical protein
MRPARILTAVVFAAAVAVTGCAAHPTAVAPPAAPVTPAAAPPPPAPVPDPPVLHPTPPTPPRPPVLADGHYDAYIRTVDRGHDRLVVDLVQVFHDQAAIDAAIADGKPRDHAQVLDTYIRNQNPRLWTMPLARDLRIDLVGRSECGGGSLVHKMSVLISDVSFHSPNLYFTLTVTGGAVQHIKEVPTQPAC